MPVLRDARVVLHLGKIEGNLSLEDRLESRKLSEEEAAKLLADLLNRMDSSPWVVTKLTRVEGGELSVVLSENMTSKRVMRIRRDLGTFPIVGWVTLAGLPLAVAAYLATTGATFLALGLLLCAALIGFVAALDRWLPWAVEHQERDDIGSSTQDEDNANTTLAELAAKSKQKQPEKHAKSSGTTPF